MTNYYSITRQSNHFRTIEFNILIIFKEPLICNHKLSSKKLRPRVSKKTKNCVVNDDMWSLRVGGGVHDKLQMSSADWWDILLPLAYRHHIEGTDGF